MELNVSEKLVVNEIRHAITEVKQNKNGIGHTCYLYIQISDKEKIDNLAWSQTPGHSSFLSST